MSRLFLEEDDPTLKSPAENGDNAGAGSKQSRFFAPNEQANEPTENTVSGGDETAAPKTQPSAKNKQPAQQVAPAKKAKQQSSSKTIPEKKADAVTEAGAELLKVLTEGGKIAAKSSTLFTSFQHAISKYESYFGQNSLDKSPQFLQACVNFENAFDEFETSNLKKDKNNAKAVIQLKQKMTKAYLTKFSTQIAEFKSNSAAFDVKPDQKPVLEKSEGSSAHQTAEKSKSKSKKERQAELKSELQKQSDAAKAENENNTAQVEDVSDDIKFKTDEMEDDIHSDEDELMEQHEKKGKQKRIHENDDFDALDLDALLSDDSKIDFKTFFLKKNTAKFYKREEEKEEENKRTKLEKAQKRAAKDKAAATAQSKDAAHADQNVSVVQSLEEKHFKDIDVITDQLVIEKIIEFENMQGYKNFTVTKMLSSLNDMHTIALTHDIGLPVLLYIKLHVVNLILGSRLILGIDVISEENFAAVVEHLQSAFKLLADLKYSLRIDLGVSPEETNLINSEKPFAIQMSLIQILTDVDGEYWNILKTSGNLLTNKYLKNLRMSKTIISILESGIATLEHNSNIKQSQICALKIRLIKHLYYLPQSVEQSYPVGQKVGQLHNYICQFSHSSIEKSRSLLYYIYHLAIRGKFEMARHLLVVSSISDDADRKDIETQILYNHTIVQVGLAAFKCGEYELCHQFLSEIQCTTKCREMLGQSLSSTREKPELRKIVDPFVQIPHHLEVPLDLIEFCYLVSALFYELSKSYFIGLNQKVQCAEDLINISLSKHLKHVLIKTEREYVFLGTPDSLVEHVYLAFRSILNHNSEAAIGILTSETLMDSVYADFDVENNPQIIENLKLKIRKQCLISFLVHSKSTYSEISFHSLSNMFSLTTQQMLPIISKCIYCNQFKGHVDLKRLVLIYTPIKDRQGEEYYEEVSALLDKTKSVLNNTERLTETIQSSNLTFSNSPAGAASAQLRS